MLRLFYVISTVGLLCPGPAYLSRSVEFPGDRETCNVVNVNCGPGLDGSDQPVGPRTPGAPGKRGPMGPLGPRGPKGAKGSTGAKGESGESVDVGELRRELLKMFGAFTCDELHQAGISEPGFYLLQSKENLHPTFVYCIFVPGFSTCQQVKARFGISKTGVYSVKPMAAKPPYRIYCNFSSEQAVTEIWHSGMKEIQVDAKCEHQACYSWKPKYQLAEDEIVNVISNSQQCKQYVKFRCNGVLLFRDGHGYWLSRQGEKMTYWGGAVSRRPKYCACGETGTCVDNSFKCNCDNNDVKIGTQDEGYITDKSKLPLKELRIGDNGDPGEFVWHTVGKLECVG